MSVKLKKLLGSWPRCSILTASTLHSRGYSYDKQTKYKDSGWISSVGHGAYYRTDDGPPTIEAGVAALQTQLGLKVHVGGRSALEYYNATNQISFHQAYFLYGAPGLRLPKWFTDYKWKVPHYYSTTNLFDGDEKLGITWETDYSRSPIAFPCSTPERAILERFLEVKDQFSFELPEKDLQTLNSRMNPILLQQLLEKCQSVRVKRVFLYAASLWNYPWQTKLNLSRIDLGSGIYQFVKGGILDKQFMLTVERQIPLEEIP